MRIPARLTSAQKIIAGMCRRFGEVRLMDFNYTPEQEEFRRSLRSFLERAKAEVFGRTDDLIGGSDIDDRWQRQLEYHRRLYDAGYVALHWPKEWGGGGAEIVEQAIYQDEAL